MANSNLDEFYTAEGTSEEEWKRVYDLRYCTILVPFENDDSRSGHSEMEHKSLTTQTEQKKGQRELKEQVALVTMSSTVTKTTTTTSSEHVHLATPSATPGRPETSSPPKIASSTPTSQGRRQDLENDGDDQDDSMTTGDQCGLTERDPLSRYLTAETHPRSMSSKSSPKNLDTDMLGEDDEAESEHFHDAPSGLETDDDKINSLQISQHALSHQRNGDDDDDNAGDYASPTNSGNKRARHWELTPSQRLLHTVDPHPPKRIALSLSSSGPHGVDGINSCGLLRPRSFSPSLSPSPSIWVTPPMDHSPEHSDRTGSGGASALSQLNCIASIPTFWRKQDWKVLEDLYDELNGESMTESELGQVVDRFLAKQEFLAEGKSRWSREFVLLRCVALHRVRVQETPDVASQELYSPMMSSRTRSWRGSSPGFGNRIGAARRSVSPYPVALTRRAGSTPAWSPESSSPRSIADFVEERRADRARQQRTADQGYQIKSVFKHRLAAGLKTVGELLPFWKDVEKGHTDVKEEVVVPLVPAGRAHSVIAAFESQAAVQAQLERQHSLPARSRSGSVLSTTGGWNCESMGRSVSPAPSSIAEMISRGHATRAASASASAPTAAKTSTPLASVSLTQTSE